MQVELHNITKTFGRVRANQDISLTFEGGHIYAILGENGAGKSTLMKIMSGYQSADSGSVVVDGQRDHARTPRPTPSRTASACCTRTRSTSPRSPCSKTSSPGDRAALSPTSRRARQHFWTLVERFGFDLDPDRYVDTLTIGERQQLEILRLLSLDVRVLILDEPTTGISAEQKTALFNVLKSLARDDGMTIILVSHKLEDVIELCDHAFVLRRGRLVGEKDDSPARSATLVELMFGKMLERQRRRPPSHRRIARCVVESLCVTSRRLTVENLSLEVRAGEVIGLAGLDGSGQGEFIRACTGLHPAAEWFDPRRRAQHDAASPITSFQRRGSRSCLPGASRRA